MRNLLFPTVIMLGIIISGANTANAFNYEGELLTGESTDAVYYINEDGTRHVFPSSQVFFTWHGSFAGVKQVSDSVLSQFPIGGVVHVKPRVKLVKIQSDDKVYEVHAGGLLRWLETEDVAREMYGDKWADDVIDIPASLFNVYKRGPSIAEKPSYYNHNTLDTITEIKQNIRAKESYVDEIFASRNYSVREANNQSLPFRYGTDEENDHYMNTLSERNTRMSLVSRDNAYVLAPSDADFLAKLEVENLLSSREYISDFTGVDYSNKQIGMKLYEISNDITTRNYFHGNIMKGYNSLLDEEEGLLVTNAQGKYDYLRYTSAALTSGYPISDYFHNGLHDYLELNSPNTSYKSSYECSEYGYSNYDKWYNYEDTSNGVVCFWKQVDEEYGHDNFQKVMQRLEELEDEEYDQYNVGNEIMNTFVEDVLVDTLGTSVIGLLENHGIDRSDWEL